MSECILSNNYFIVAGICYGIFRGRQRKSMRPLVAGTAIGQLGDLFYGYYGNCRKTIDDFNIVKKHYDLQNSSEEEKK